MFFLCQTNPLDVSNKKLLNLKKKNHLGTEIIYTNEANERKFIIPKWIFFFLWQCGWQWIPTIDESASTPFQHLRLLM